MIGDKLLRCTPPVSLAWSCPWFIVIVISSVWTVATGIIDGSVMALIAAAVAISITVYVVGIRLVHRVPLRSDLCRR